MRLARYSLLPLLFFAVQTNAQDLSGTWEGSASSGSNFIRMVLVKVGNKYVGYTYDTDVRGGHCRADIQATFNSKSNSFKTQSLRLTENSGSHVSCTYHLSLAKVEGVEWLSGNQRAGNLVSFIANMGMTNNPAYLKRVSTSIDTSAFMRRTIAEAAPAPKAEAPLPPPAETAQTASPASATPVQSAVVPAVKNDTAVLLALKEERKSDLVQEITTEARSITIRVYDNGIQDGDTVSILHNNRVIADHLPVREASYSVTVQLDDKAPVNEITLIAHNLGRIPPNTASLVVEAGDERYRLTASTDLGRNAVIRIKPRNR